MQSAHGQQPRDRLGRPLRGDLAATHAFAQVPERDVITSGAAWSEAVDYLNQDLPFHVHEVCEQRWRCAPPAERELWQALAQWGAALTHRARGNTVGAQRLALRSLAKLDHLGPSDRVPDCVDLTLVRESLASDFT